MFKALKDWYDDKALNGLNFFYANDKTTGKPSVTLFMVYVSFIISCVVISVLQFRADPILAALVSLLFTALMIVFYMIRSINKAKFDLSKQALELESGEEKKDAQ